MLVLAVFLTKQKKLEKHVHVVLCQFIILPDSEDRKKPKHKNGDIIANHALRNKNHTGGYAKMQAMMHQYITEFSQIKVQQKTHQPPTTKFVQEVGLYQVKSTNLAIEYVSCSPKPCLLLFVTDTIRMYS